MPTRVDADRILRFGACLSLSGRFARFGSQAAAALELWKLSDGYAELIVDDDKSSPETLGRILPKLARSCDVLLSPYSTQLVRIAGRIAAEENVILWNHGGSGDDVEASQPGRQISILTPASRYAESFIRHLKDSYSPARLLITHGKGAFGRQVADGGASAAQRMGIDSLRVPRDYVHDWPFSAPVAWDLLSAGTFEDDVELIRAVKGRSSMPRATCCVAAGVREFDDAVQGAEGIYGVGQWFPGSAEPTPQLGPTEADFVAAYSTRQNAAPDYPAIQAVAAAVVAAHCVRKAGNTAPDAVWLVAAGLATDTLFGAFKIDPRTGVQIGHQGVLVRWSAGALALA